MSEIDSLNLRLSNERKTDNECKTRYFSHLQCSSDSLFVSFSQKLRFLPLGRFSANNDRDSMTSFSFTPVSQKSNSLQLSLAFIKEQRAKRLFWTYLSARQGQALFTFRRQKN